MPDKAPCTSTTVASPLNSLSSLSPGAAALVEAGKQLLIDGGVDSLRVAKITEAAGQNRAMINYYFGNKATMVAVVVDSLIHEAVEGLVTQAEQLPRGEGRVGAHVMNTLAITQTPEFLSTIDVIPAARRAEDLRERLANLYEWYREINAECLDPAAHAQRSERLNAVATLFVALYDGLAIQWALDPEAVDLERLAEMIKEMIAAVLRPPAE